MYQLGLTDRPTLPINSVFEKGNVHHETYRRSQNTHFSKQKFHWPRSRSLHESWPGAP